jgi:succinyl-diaminopimelate desuccinylase
LEQKPDAPRDAGTAQDILKGACRAAVTAEIDRVLMSVVEVQRKSPTGRSGVTAAQRKAVVHHVDSQRARQTDFLLELARESAENPPGHCARDAARAALLLEQLGFTVERHPVPKYLVKAREMLSVTNLIVRRRFGAGPIVALHAHGDVLPERSPGTRRGGPEIRDGQVHGQGLADSKFDFATYAFALRALEQAADAHGLQLGGTVELHFTYDDQAGGELGPKWLLDSGRARPDYVIGTGSSAEITQAHNGFLHMEVSVRAPNAGDSRSTLELSAATKLVKPVYELHDRCSSLRSSIPGIAPPSIALGFVREEADPGSDAFRFCIDRCLIPEEDPDDVERELVDAISAAAQPLADVIVSCRRTHLIPPVSARPGQGRLIGLIRRHGRAITGGDLTVRGRPFYSGIRHYHAAGIPAVSYGAGPSLDIDAEGEDGAASLKLDDMRNATAVVALAVADLVGQA